MPFPWGWSWPIFQKRTCICTSMLAGNELRGGKATLYSVCWHPIVSALPHWLCGSFPWLQRQIRVKCHHVPFSDNPINTLMQSWPDMSSMALTMSLQLTVTKVAFQGSVGTQPWFKIVKQCFIVKEWIILSLLRSSWIMSHSFTENHWLTYT